MLFGKRTKTGKPGSGKRSDKGRGKDAPKDAKAVRSGSQRFAGLRRRKAGIAANGSIKKLFHGVAVRARGNGCCEAVEALGGQRFLSEEAPLLPLAECSNPQGCRCVYEHFDERRDNLRRESDVGLPVRTHPDEKRDGHGRRITDG